MLILCVSFPSMSTCWLLPSSTATRIVLLLISTDTWKGREKSISKVPAPFPAALLGLWGQEHSLGMREREEPSACTEGGWESHCCLGANSSEVKGNLSREQQAAQPCRDSHRASVSPYRKPVRRSGAHLLHPSTEGGTALRLPEPSAALPGGLGLPSQEPGVTPAQQQLEAPQLCMAPTPRHSQHWAVAKGQSAGLAAKGCVCVSPRLEGTRQLCYSCSSHTGNPAATRCEVTRPPGTRQQAAPWSCCTAHLRPQRAPLVLPCMARMQGAGLEGGHSLGPLVLPALTREEETAVRFACILSQSSPRSSSRSAELI